MLVSLNLQKDILINRLDDIGCYEGIHFNFIGRGVDFDLFEPPIYDVCDDDCDACDIM